MSIAIINAIGLTDYFLIILCNVIILLGAWIIDNPNILRGVQNMRITLDHIPQGILNNSEDMRGLLSKEFGVDVISYSVSTIDYVKDTTRVRIAYRANIKNKKAS